MDDIKEFLKKSNEFEPCLGLNKEQFGRLNLKDYFSKNFEAKLEDKKENDVAREDEDEDADDDDDDEDDDEDTDVDEDYENDEDDEDDDDYEYDKVSDDDDEDKKYFKKKTVYKFCKFFKKL